MTTSATGPEEEKRSRLQCPHIESPSAESERVIGSKCNHYDSCASRTGKKSDLFRVIWP